jgi:hypothetical protein
MTEPTNDEPLKDVVEDDAVAEDVVEDIAQDEDYDTYDDEDDEHEIPINERKLLWSIVIVLAIFSVIEGLTIVSWGSRIRRLEQGAGPVGTASIGGGGGGALGGGGAAFQPGAGPSGVDVGSGHTMVAGRAAVMQRVEEFITANELEAAMAESLRVLMEDSERKLEELPSKEAAGEIAADERVTILREELDRREQEAEKLLGEELAAKLTDVLTSGPVGGPPTGAAGDLGPAPGGGDKGPAPGGPGGPAGPGGPGGPAGPGGPGDPGAPPPPGSTPPPAATEITATP